MTDLTDFLLARFADDEAAAKAASHLAPSGPDPAYVSLVDPLLVMQQRFDPPRVLAECEAKRRIVEWADRYEEAVADYPGLPRLDGARNAAAMALRYLALPYADHPDWREDWKP